MCDGCQAHPFDAAGQAREPAVPPPCPAEPLSGEEQEQLERLIAEQAADDAERHVERHKREIPATDLDGRTTARKGRREAATGTAPNHGWRMLETAVDHRCSPRAWEAEVLRAIDLAATKAVKSGGENRAGRQPDLQYPILFFTGTGRTWDASEVGYDPLNGPCPACRDLRMSPSYCCAVCHYTVDSPTRWPMKTPEVKGKPAGAGAGKRVRVKRKAAKENPAKADTAR